MMICTTCASSICSAGGPALCGGCMLNGSHDTLCGSYMGGQDGCSTSSSIACVLVRVCL